jgi:hypothetical protein
MGQHLAVPRDDSTGSATSAEPWLSTASVVIVGATGLVGSALAERLHAAGAVLTLHGRRVDALVALSRRLRGSASLLGDVRDAATAGRLVDAALQHTGRIDGVVICVGAGAALAGSTPTTRAETVDRVLLEEVLLTGTLGPLWVVQAALPELRRSGGFAVLVVDRVLRVDSAALSVTRSWGDDAVTVMRGVGDGVPAADDARAAAVEASAAATVAAVTRWGEQARAHASGVRRMTIGTVDASDAGVSVTVDRVMATIRADGSRRSAAEVT